MALLVQIPLSKVSSSNIYLLFDNWQTKVSSMDLIKYTLKSFQTKPIKLNKIEKPANLFNLCQASPYQQFFLPILPECSHKIRNDFPFAAPTPKLSTVPKHFPQIFCQTFQRTSDSEANDTAKVNYPCNFFNL